MASTIATNWRTEMGLIGRRAGTDSTFLPGGAKMTWLLPGCRKGMWSGDRFELLDAPVAARFAPHPGEQLVVLGIVVTSVGRHCPHSPDRRERSSAALHLAAGPKVKPQQRPLQARLDWFPLAPIRGHRDDAALDMNLRLRFVKCRIHASIRPPSITTMLPVM
jgi:hypothetical protein